MSLNAKTLAGLMGRAASFMENIGKITKFTSSRYTEGGKLVLTHELRLTVRQEVTDLALAQCGPNERSMLIKEMERDAHRQLEAELYGDISKAITELRWELYQVAASPAWLGPQGVNLDHPVWKKLTAAQELCRI